MTTNAIATLKPAQNAAPIKAGKGKHSDLYQSVTDTVINQLEAGAVPWVQPWGRPDCKTPFGMPTNGNTGRLISCSYGARLLIHSAPRKLGSPINRPKN